MESMNPIPEEYRHWISLEGYSKWLEYYTHGINNMSVVRDSCLLDQDPMIKIRQLSDGWTTEEIHVDSTGFEWLHPDEFGKYGLGLENSSPDLIDKLGLTYESKGLPSFVKSWRIKRTRADFYLLGVYGREYFYQVETSLIWKDGKSPFKVEKFGGHPGAVVTEEDIVRLGRPIKIRSKLSFFGNGA